MVKKNPKVVRIKSPHNRWTPLDVAIEVGKLEIAKYLWKKDGRPNFNAYCDGTHTPVHEAARCEHAVTLNWVFENEVLPLDIMLKIKNHDKNTLLDIAIGHGRLEEMAKYLWEKGGRPNLEIYRDRIFTPVHWAAKIGNIVNLKWVFTEKVLPLRVFNVKDQWKMTPLDWAIYWGNRKTAAFLRRLVYVYPVLWAMQCTKRDFHQMCVLRRLPDELLDMVVDEVAARFNLVVVW